MTVFIVVTMLDSWSSLICLLACRCTSEALTAVAMLSTDNIYFQPHTEEEKQVRVAITTYFYNVNVVHTGDDIICAALFLY